MNIAIQKQSSIQTDINKIFGLKVRFRKIQSWVANQDKVQQAFILSRSKENKVTIFITLNSKASKIEKQEYVEHLKSQMSERFQSHLLPSIFIFIDTENKELSYKEFKNNILAQKFLSWDAFDIRLNYWSNSLTNIPHLHNLPTDKSRQINHKSSRLTITSSLKTGVYDSLKHMCEQMEIDTFLFLQTAFSILICRYSNDSDIIMGAKFSDVYSHKGQVASKVHFDELILRNYISGNPFFSEQLKRNKTVIQRAYANRAPYSEIQKRIRIQEDLIYEIFQIKFNYQLVSSNDSEILNSWLNSIHDENLLFKYDLELSVTDTKQGLFLNWFYNANIFNQDTINRLAVSFELLIQSILKSIEQPVYSLSLLNIEEQSKLLNDWNYSTTPTSDMSIDDCFEEQVRKTPDSIAVRFGSQALSYQVLNSRAERVASLLSSQGVISKSIVAVCLDESSCLIITILGILKADATYMPLDPSFPRARLEFVLKDSQVSTLVVDNQERQLEFPGLEVISINEKSLFELPDESVSIVSRDKRELCAISDNAYVMYTSGSTNQPKGVLGTHKNVMNRLAWMKRKYQVTNKDIFCLKTSVSSVDHIAEIFQPLVCGASLVILKKSVSNNMSEIAKIIQDYQITRLTLLPSSLKSLLEAGFKPLKSLKYIISSGEPLHTHLVETFHKILGGNTSLLNLYGATETGADVSCFEVNFDDKCSVFTYFAPQKHQDQGDLPTDIFGQLSHYHDNEGLGEITKPNISLEHLKNRYMETQIPVKPISLDSYLNRLKIDMVPFLVNVSSEKYIGHMTSPLPNFIPEFNKYLAKINQNVVKVETAKSLTLMERQVLAMLHRLFFNFDYEFYQDGVQEPNAVYGVVTSGGSLSNITALFCARNAGILSRGITESELREFGAVKAAQKLGYDESVILVSQLAHYSIKKAASLLGIGHAGLLTIEQDENQKVNTSALEALIEKCSLEKKHIIAIVGIAGATETGTIDPLDEMANIAEKHGIHFHVDAAWGGAFIFSEKYKHKLKGIERADSITICAHKQLYISQGISVCLFKDVKNIFSITTHAEYQSQKGSFDLGQFTLEGSRPALSVLLHASFHLFASTGYARLIEQSMEKTSFLRNVLAKSDCFQLVGENDLNIINYRYIPKSLRDLEEDFGDEANRLMDKATELIQRKQFQEGKTFVSKTRILFKPYSSKKITVFRIILANPNTSYEDILEVLEEQLRIASREIECEQAGHLHYSSTPKLAVNSGEMVSVPIGHPIDNVALYILDEYLNPVPIGVIGELHVAGDCLSNGYLNQDSLNQESFIENPFNAYKTHMFKSGDLARRLPNGDIEYVGRKDLQIKLKGHRVNLQEIKVQLDKLEQVKYSIVLVENDAFSDNVLTAYVELMRKSTPREKSQKGEIIIAELKALMPEFMIPSTVKIFDQIPLTPNGKIDFKNL